MASREPVRVMVVDDQPDARLLVRVVLDACDDLEVVAEASGAPAALDLAARTAPDVALVDARMPGVDGFELAPRLRAVLPGLRIAMLTSYVDDAVRAQAAQAGIGTCAVKGDINALPDLVRRVARGVDT